MTNPKSPLTVRELLRTLIDCSAERSKYLHGRGQDGCVFVIEQMKQVFEFAASRVEAEGAKGVLRWSCRIDGHTMPSAGDPRPTACKFPACECPLIPALVAGTSPPAKAEGYWARPQTDTLPTAETSPPSTGAPTKTELDRLIDDAREKVKRMSPEEFEAMIRAQRESWVRGESGIDETATTILLSATPKPPQPEAGTQAHRSIWVGIHDEVGPIVCQFDAPTEQQRSVGGQYRWREIAIPPAPHPAPADGGILPPYGPDQILAWLKFHNIDYYKELLTPLSRELRRLTRPTVTQATAGTEDEHK